MCILCLYDVNLMLETTSPDNWFTQLFKLYAMSGKTEQAINLCEAASMVLTHLTLSLRASISFAYQY